MGKEQIWLITGVCGQDGSHFCDYLLELGYTNIHGIIRRSATFNTQNIDHIFDRLRLHYGDLTDAANVFSIIQKVQPDFIVNFAAQSHVKVSHDLENYTFQVNTIGVLNILQSVRMLGMTSKCKIYHASTSEMYGNQTEGDMKLNENSPMTPVSIYGISKLAAQQICNMYRDAYHMFVVSSILFNHEGTRRGFTFVTQKISNYVAKFSKNQTHEPLLLGNLNARRDWGLARIYVQAIYKMLMREEPQNYVIATGETHSVREFVEIAFQYVGVKIFWKGEGIHEKGYDRDTGKLLVGVHPKYYRDIDIECLIGDPSKAEKELGWSYPSNFKDMVKEMVSFAIQRET